MPITQQTPLISYTASGSATQFPFPFKAVNSADLKVYVNGVLQTSGYTVSGIGPDSGGTVTFAVAPAAGAVVRLQRLVQLDRTTDWIEGGALPAATLDFDSDRVVMMVQDLTAISLLESNDGTFDAESKRIKNVVDPVNANDAVNKQYYEGTYAPQIAASIAAGQSAINTTLADATAQAGIATTQAGVSTTQAGIATTQATNAANSATASDASATAATAMAGIATAKAAEASSSAAVAASYSAGVLGGINTFTSDNTFNSTVSVLDKLGVGGAPTEKFDVIGTSGTVSINATGDSITLSNAGYNYLNAYGAGATLQVYGTYAVTLATAGYERVRISNAGNLTMTTAGSSIISGGAVVIGAGGSSAAGSIYSDANYGMIITAKTAAPVSAEFMLRNAGATERMRIDTAGNVGIGTMSPGYRLQVQADGPTFSNWIMSKNATATGAYGSGFIAMAGAGAQYCMLYEDAAGDCYLTNAVAGNLKIGTNNLVRFSIDSAGSILQSTSVNSGLFTTVQNLNAGAAAQAVVKTQSDNGSLYMVASSTAQGGGATLYSDSTAGALTIKTYNAIPLTLGTANATRLQIGTAGQFGIGGATYGTAGQVLTSGGPSAAPTWSTINLASCVKNDGSSAIGLSGWVWMITAPTLYGWVAGSNLYFNIGAWGMSNLTSGTWRIMQTGQSYYDGSSAYYYPVLVQRTA